MIVIEQMLTQFFKGCGIRDFRDVFCDMGLVYFGHRFIFVPF